MDFSQEYINRQAAGETFVKKYNGTKDRHTYCMKNYVLLYKRFRIKKPRLMKLLKSYCLLKISFEIKQKSKL